MGSWNVMLLTTAMMMLGFTVDAHASCRVKNKTTENVRVQTGLRSQTVLPGATVNVDSGSVQGWMGGEEFQEFCPRGASLVLKRKDGKLRTKVETGKPGRLDFESSNGFDSQVRSSRKSCCTKIRIKDGRVQLQPPQN